MQTVDCFSTYLAKQIILPLVPHACVFLDLLTNCYMCSHVQDMMTNPTALAKLGWFLMEARHKQGRAQKDCIMISPPNHGTCQLPCVLNVAVLIPVCGQCTSAVCTSGSYVHPCKPCLPSTLCLGRNDSIFLSARSGLVINKLSSYKVVRTQRYRCSQNAVVDSRLPCCHMDNVTYKVSLHGIGVMRYGNKCV